MSTTIPTHGDQDALVDDDNHRNSSREMESNPVAVVNRSPTKRRTNEGGNVDKAASRQGNVIRDSERMEADITISYRVEIFMNSLVACRYVTP